ncbi:hypothetical protein [Palleronia caenipelagi]|uniref:HTH DNA binding domain-containing protein n=1 Tax=Palleronia caenipelagi TaxID=2489174 RepID=A0A547PNE9_9RHOB|nr:hypothetical protein [Palleronia caenipelagi]TRD15668.1 hypothetical protein FEV53_15390 [Palleronia caenipelagi]
MTSQRPTYRDNTDDPFEDAEDATEEDLWFLPPPLEQEPDLLPPGPQLPPDEADLLRDWRAAEAGQAARLAQAAGRLGALGDRLSRGPEGWRHRLALTEAAELSWIAGDRVGADRLALWMALHLAGVQDDMAALARAAWAMRRLTGGPGPEAGLAGFLDRRDPEAGTGEDRFADRAGGWEAAMAEASALHPITRAAMGVHLWALAGLGEAGDPLEAAVTAARIAASDSGAVFAPVAMGGAGALRPGGTPGERLGRWLSGMESGVLAAMRHLDEIELWSARAEATMSRLSGRTPPALRKAFASWPLLSAPMAEDLTGASRAAVQRNLTWMEEHGLIREVTGQGRFRMWKAAG